MELIQTISRLRSELDKLRSEGKTIGLVPTMGALHAGHASLVERAVGENDVVVVRSLMIRMIWPNIPERWRRIVICWPNVG